MNNEAVIDRSLQWVRRFVIGLDLCPFAARVVDSGRLGWEVTPAGDPESAYRDFLACLEGFVTADQPETLLFVLPEAVPGFESFLDLLEQCEWAIDQAGLADRVQLASFHPDYRFDGAPPDDPANHSNRSPYPMLHLLRHDSVARAVAGHPNPSHIPERNCALLRRMGEQEIARWKREE